MQDKGCNCGASFKLGAGQPLLSMRLFCTVIVSNQLSVIPLPKGIRIGGEPIDTSDLWQALQLLVIAT